MIDSIHFSAISVLTFVGADLSFDLSVLRVLTDVDTQLKVQQFC